MNNWAKVGIAAIAIGVACTSTYAQSVQLFGGNPSDSGVVFGSSGKVTTISGVKSTLFSLYGGEFAAGLYTIDFSSLSNTITVTDSGSNQVLAGQVSVITNSFDADNADANGPTFSLSGNVSFTSGSWLDSIRRLSTGVANGQGVGGYFSMSGNNGVPPPGVESINMRASAVPEPSEWAAIGLLGTSLGGLVLRARRKKI